MVLNEEFGTLDKRIWEHEITARYDYVSSVFVFLLFSYSGRVVKGSKDDQNNITVGVSFVYLMRRIILHIK